MHLAWIKTPRNKGGLGHIKIPILADVKKVSPLTCSCTPFIVSLICFTVSDHTHEIAADQSLPLSQNVRKAISPCSIALKGGWASRQTDDITSLVREQYGSDHAREVYSIHGSTSDHHLWHQALPKSRNVRGCTYSQATLMKNAWHVTAVCLSSPAKGMYLYLPYLM